MRVLLDASVIVAALTTPNPASASRVVLSAAAAGAIQLLVTDDVEAEYRRAVEYPQVSRFAPRVDRQAFVAGVVELAERVTPATTRRLVAADPNDDMVVAAAIGGRADYLVSLDGHLLKLGKAGEFRILTPGALLDVLRRAGY